ncbi:MAG: serine/threonine protein kinase, partial [Myxococcota bacterium]|nr:serine/threonine protein kinase [Myxococcota bacterium]
MGEVARGFSSAAHPLPVPRSLGRRTLLKLAARGGMGDVYLAATTGIEGAERPCIVKTVRRDHIHDGSFLARFVDEARVQSQLQHPGVAQVLEAATDDAGEPFTVVEYVEGRSLAEVRQRAVQAGVQIAWADAVAVAIEIAQALAHVHERSAADGTPLGIVHRDLSPQNVMLGYAGELKLIDFGTARGHNRRCQTVAGVVFAKPGYVAPEVARQQVGDGRIDLYALGVILWELCAGRRLLSTDPQRHLDDAAENRIIVPPAAHRCGAPPELDEIIARLTKNDPDERYTRAALAVPALASLLASAPPAAGGERGVRGRIAMLMQRLWPHEPGRSRQEFARLLRHANTVLQAAGQRGNETPSAPQVGEGLAARMMPHDPSHLAGTPYRLVRVIGSGANGDVWEAEHVELGRSVALKVLAAEHAASQASLERFRSEARAVARLAHPNLVPIHDFGRSLDGRVFLAMELCVGETLDVRLRAGPLGWREAARIAADTADALSAAHASGLVHCDLKPQNLMLTRSGEIKLLDFGVARAVSGENGTSVAKSMAANGEAGPRRAFAIFGTPEYMAPEQVEGAPVDARTDVYALGSVLYEMLTGTCAFDGSSSVVVMGKQLREQPIAPRMRAPGRAIPVALEAIVMRAMAKNPLQRFESAHAVREALSAVLAGPELQRARVRSALSGALMIAAMVAAGAMTAVTTSYWVHARSKTPTAIVERASAVASLPAGSTEVQPAPRLAPLSEGTPPIAKLLLAGGATAAAVAAIDVPSLRDARAASRAHPGDVRATEA